MENKDKPIIFIDGDACPVKEIIIEEALQTGFSVILVCSFDHFTHQDFPANVQVKYVESGHDRVDFEIMGMIRKQDLLVTQDYGLASLALEKGVHVMHHQGFSYEQETIDAMLYQRYIMSEERRKTKRQKKIGTLLSIENHDFQKFFHKQLKKLEIVWEN